MKNIYKIYDMTEIFNIKENIYITSDETAYPYALHLKKQEVLKIKGVGENSGELYHDKGFSYPYECQKIILTTDQDLIEDGVQAIDDEFLEWFVKNQSCEEVMLWRFHGINTSIAEVNAISGDGSLNWQGKDDLRDYKIIIPKEEPKQNKIDFMANELVIEKERMYSEEDLIYAFNEGQALNIRGKLIQGKEWFEQFKKK